MCACRAPLAVVVLLSCPLTLAAQQPSGAGGGRPISVGVIGGLSAGLGDSGGAIGGAAAFAISERLAVEGRGVYMDRGPGADALDIHASLVVNLLTGRRAIPFVALGAGLYRASFDLDDRRYLGMMGSLAPGTQVVPTTRGWGMMGPVDNQWSPGWMMRDFAWHGTTWSGPHYEGSQMPMFYATRLGAMTMPRDGRWGRRAFVDPAITFGGGVRLDLTEALYLRPDVRALMVVADGDTFTIGSVSVGLGYRF